MADLKTSFLGIESPNPFWLASAPPTDKAYNVNRAFEAGWGGAVWKTLGEAGPPIVNVSGPRYSALHSNDRRVIGFNNVELITDRPLKTNLDEIRQIRRDWPDRALVASVMLPMQEASWAKYVPMIEDTGAHAFELNFGCPHGMSERGMGSAVGQVPEYIQQATEWAKKYATIPVIIKLTPNVTNILPPAKARFLGARWRQKFVFEFLIPPPKSILKWRLERSRREAHPVDQGVTLEQVEMQVAVYCEVALHFHRSGLLTYVRDDYDGVPKNIVDTEQAELQNVEVRHWGT